MFLAAIAVGGTVAPPQTNILRPVPLSVSCMDTIKQTYVFCEAHLSVFFTACFIAGRSFHGVSPSPAASCQQSESLCRLSKFPCNLCNDDKRVLPPEVRPNYSLQNK